MPISTDDHRLVIELDGPVHQAQQLRDQDRDRWMEANSLTVLRFSNDEVFDQTETVLEAIANAICPSSPEFPSPLAPLPAGEGDRSDLPSLAGRRVWDVELALPAGWGTFIP